MSDGGVINKKKRPPVRPDRNSPEAQMEERSQPYEEMGESDEAIRKKPKPHLSQEPGDDVPAVPTDGS